MTKLLHISANTYPPLNHNNHHTKNIWKELAKEFDEYHIFARSKTNKYNFSKEGNIYLHLIPKITIKSKIFFFTSFYMFYLIKKYKITHLLSQCPLIGGFTATLASKFFQIPLMLEIHGEEYFKILKKDSILNKLLSSILIYDFRNAQKIRSLNNEMTEKLNKYNITKNIVVIPNRVNLNLFNKQKENYKITNNIKLVSVGRFVWEKDYLNLIKTLHQSELNFSLILIGGGKLKEKYLDYINTNNLNNIKLIDWIEQKELVNKIIDADIYIQSSISEGMPRTILEAMALRMPIISTNVGSIIGVLKDNHNAIIIDSDYSKILVEKINLLIKDDTLRKKIAFQGYTDVCEKYEWNKVFELYRYEIKSMKYENS